MKRAYRLPIWFKEQETKAVNEDKRQGKQQCTHVAPKKRDGTMQNEIKGFPVRSGHAAVAVGPMIYSVGGDPDYGPNDVLPNRPIDIHTLNTTDLSVRWKELKFKATEDTPSERWRHTVVAYDERIYMWGGDTAAGSCDVLFEFRTATNTWHKPAVGGPVPKARNCHSAVLIATKMYIHGGVREDDGFFSDLHALDLSTFIWAPVITQGVPRTCRWLHSAAVSQDRFMVIFGGREDDDFDGQVEPSPSKHRILNTLTQLDTTTNEWKHLEPTGSIPPARYAHSAFMYKGSLYIFGGHDTKTHQYFNDYFCFVPGMNEWTEVVPSESERPTLRSSPGCVVVRDQLFIFGGDIREQYFHDTYALNLANLKNISPLLSEATEAELGTASKNVPTLAPPPKTVRWSMDFPGFPALVGHAAAAVDDVVYSFGGSPHTDTFTWRGPLDVYMLETAKLTMHWKQLYVLPQTNMPHKRAGHTAVVHGRHVYIWGGDSLVETASNVLYRFNVDAVEWERPKVSGKVPTACHHHTAAVIGHKMYVYGGGWFCKGNSVDLEVLDLNSFNWSTIVTKGLPPRVLIYHTATAFSDRFMYVFGGVEGMDVTGRPPRCNTLLRFDAVTKHWEVVKAIGTPPTSEAHHSAFLYNGSIFIVSSADPINPKNDDCIELFRFDPEMSEWHQVVPKGKKPLARNGFASVVVGDRVFIFGRKNEERSSVGETLVLEINK